MIAQDGVLLQAGTIGGIVGLVLVVGGVIVMWRNGIPFSSQNINDHKTDVTSDDPGFDFTNEEVQQLLRDDKAFAANLDGLINDGLARLVYEGNNESHYAVVDIWWSQIARRLGYETPGTNDNGVYFIMAATTSAYQNHAERVGSHPTVESSIGGTSPFVVEHQSDQDERE